MNSKDIIKALVNNAEGRGAVYMSECQIGRKGLRVDFWTMMPSWVTPTPICYEIKISRADFLRDKKWPEYLPYCERFYFVCPAQLLTPMDIDARAGLVWITPAGEYLLIRRAPKMKMEEQHLWAMLRRMLFHYMYPDGRTLQQPRELQPTASSAQEA